MLIEYIHKALEKAQYEILGEDEPYYGEVPELEECRKNLEEVIDEWIIFRLRKGLSFPPQAALHHQE
jgi:predicted RNase H-like HicB family nuclease